MRGAHPGYITTGQYEANLATLAANAAARGPDRAAGPAREGPALLQGIIICGRCGNRMTIRYHTRGGQQTPTYVCQRDGGLTSGEGRPFHRLIIRNIRDHYQLRSREQRLHDAGNLTLTEIASRLSVSTGTIKTWHHAGLLTGHPYNDKGQCLYPRPAPTPQPAHKDANSADDAPPLPLTTRNPAMKCQTPPLPSPPGQHQNTTHRSGKVQYSTRGFIRGLRTFHSTVRIPASARTTFERGSEVRSPAADHELDALPLPPDTADLLMPPVGDQTVKRLATETRACAGIHE